MIIQSKPVLDHCSVYTASVELPFLDVKLLSVTLNSSGDFWAHFECNQRHDDEPTTYEFNFAEAERPPEADGWRYVATFERAGFEHIYARHRR